jgi:hypothetical protein
VRAVGSGWERMLPFAEGVYANFLSDEGERGVQTAFGERLARLVALKGSPRP